MLRKTIYVHDADVAAGSAWPTLRVARISSNRVVLCDEIQGELCVSVLWRLMDLCVVPAEQRARAGHNSNHAVGMRSALEHLEINLSVKDPPDTAGTSILGPLTTNYPMLARSLRVLTIGYNDYDESADLAAFAALATDLSEITFRDSGFSSVRGLEERCEYLRKVDVGGCWGLSSLAGLEHHMFLAEMDASFTAIASIRELRTCPSLTKVDVGGCEHLDTLAGLEGHLKLEEVIASFIAVISVEALLTCPALKTVGLCGCGMLLPVGIAFPAHISIR